MSHHQTQLGLVLMLLGLLPGCASLANMAAFQRFPEASASNPVVDMACIWQQGEGRDEKGMPCRGFCGQIMFQTGASRTPAIVNGDVSIYVFDNVGTREEQVKPFKVFHFTNEEWQAFRRKTNMGMTYQLFLPYTRPGGHSADCSLRIKYVPAGTNAPIYSHSETVALRGANAAGNAAAALDRQLASSSPLFAQSPLMKGGSGADAAYADLMRKLQTEHAGPVATPAEKSTVTRADHAQTTGSRPQIQRLQSILDETASGNVEPASH